MANLRWWSSDVRHRGSASLRRGHHRPRRQRLGPERHLPSGPLSLSLSLSLSKFFQIFFGFDFQNSVRSGCFSCSIFIFLNFFLNFFIDLCGELVFLNLFVFLENFIRKMLYTLIRLISWGSGCHCSSAIDLDGINVIWFWICRNFRFWFRDFSVKFVGLERKFWILRFYFFLCIDLVSDDGLVD